jgi:hypothetical protein
MVKDAVLAEAGTAQMVNIAMVGRDGRLGKSVGCSALHAGERACRDDYCEPRGTKRDR